MKISKALNPLFSLSYPLIISILILQSCKDNTLFVSIPSSHSGICFENTIVENDSVNQLDNGNVYNGGGVGIGDFNNDGLPDIYFTGNLVKNRLYLNKGNFRFTDITEASGTGGDGRWSRGVAVIDINNDGWQDIYVSATISRIPALRRNLLFVNQGNSGKGIPVFSEEAAGYGLDDDSHTTQASFFDYDNDGDLDVYLVVNEVNDRNAPYLFRPVSEPAPGPGRGKLLRNDFNSTVNHPVFTDVTAAAGIGLEGYGNQATILDINEDGWKDIYVSNDYLTPDLLWVNNHDGTFTESLSHYFRHTSNSAMGNDAADINNDGLMDILTLDMNPEDNYRKKMMLLPSSYQFFQNSDRYGYVYQYTRNTLQLNQGRRTGEEEVPGDPVFSEISYYAGVEATDWSWCTLFSDFDNDGYNDIFIANGFPRDITDRDFGMYRSNAWLSTPRMEVLKQVPEVRIHNYIYRNNGDLTFKNMSAAWGLHEPGFSNGAAVADLDADGDLDLVVNNINDKASLYRNTVRENSKGSANFLAVELKGASDNMKGIGAIITIHYDNGKKQVREIAPFRGYLSTSSADAHFGLGNISMVDSLTVIWPNGKRQELKHIQSDKTIVLAESDASAGRNSLVASVDNIPVFREVTSQKGIDYIDEETDFVDFNIQKLIPHKYSESGPALASGDLNGDGLDDLIAGGSAGHSAQIFFQRKDGTFLQRSLPGKTTSDKKLWDDAGILLFDPDGDGDNDIYIASGGYENEDGSSSFSDHFYLNDGYGNFTGYTDLVPQNLVSKGCVRAVDYDNDGDQDIFVAGRVKPWSYPLPVSSFIYRNDSHDGKILFTDVTSQVAGGLVNLGLVSDALFTDFDSDGWTDLLLAGEWMPLIVMKNEKGAFVDITQNTGTEDLTGWWNSLLPGDFDNDGDPDYIAGNLGLNSFYRASPGKPVSVYSHDFDNNGSYDAFLSQFILSELNDTVFGDHPVHGRDDLIKQMLSMRAKFPTFKSLATATIDKLFTPQQVKDALILKAKELRSVLFRNDGGGKFTPITLPAQAQLSALNGMLTDDFDGDGNLDILINNNDYSTEVLTGRYDALSGLLLKGLGNGQFVPHTISSAGIYIPGNGKALVNLLGSDGSYLVAASQNRGPLKLFRLNREVKTVRFQSDETVAELYMDDGNRKIISLNSGASYLSQSSRIITLPEGTAKVVFSNSLGRKREIEINKNKKTFMP